ncbi:hypothetical protein G7Z17_g9571 [Cylindrodendrum hubeiense]|uniref:Uncharacterized protein n=1 Tax=Cylindrodendrum hubeiense TaxID=595255 RepID=A0A9P5LD75_9HYPO|nr:hypothetical protein G7Z17_g9571 [Cylindrodendrum hubeiense]
MKYNAIAFAPLLAAVAEASLLSLEIGLGADVKLPSGLSLPSGNYGPKSEPPADCTDVWHPPHHGVDIDDCDNDSDEEWHWVHPGTNHPDQEEYAWTTQTVHATKVHTVTDCPAYVTNCPSHHTYVTTVEVPATTTICPVPVKSAYKAPTTEAEYIVPTTEAEYVVPTTEAEYEVPTTEAEYELPSVTETYEQPAETTSCPPEEETSTVYSPPATKKYEVSSVSHPYVKPETTPCPPGQETYPVPAGSSTNWVPVVPEYTAPAAVTPGYTPIEIPSYPSKPTNGYVPPAGSPSKVYPPYPTDVPTTIVPVVPEIPTEYGSTPTPVVPVVVGSAARNAGGLFAIIAAVAALL